MPSQLPPTPTVGNIDLTPTKHQIGTWVFDLATGKIEVNRNLFSIFGYGANPPEWNIDLYYRHLYPEDLPHLKEFHENLASDPNEYYIEFRIRRLDGQTRWIKSIAGVVHDQSGKPVTMQGVIIDITERKLLKEQIKGERTQWIFASESCHLGLWVCYLPSLEVIRNAAHARIFGYDPETAPPWSMPLFLEHILPEDRPHVQSIIDEALQKKEDYRFECRIRRFGGAVRWLVVTASVVLDESDRIKSVIGVIHDITEQKEKDVKLSLLQEQLQQTQKMDLLGQLAGGIAHDFNNMLAAIQGNTELVLKDISWTNPHYQNLLTVTHTVSRSAAMVRQLLAFARKQPVSPREVELDHELEKIYLMLRKLVREDISLRWQLNCPTLIVTIDPASLVQIVTNLCINARDAIDGYGIITLTTSIVDTESCDALRQVAVNASGEHAKIRISDNGLGINPHALPHIFEPFFTTKEIGKGTGLGLPMVYGLLKQNDGHVTCHSELGKGTTFDIYLPITQRTSTPVDRTEHKIDQVISKKLSVLVVEDEHDIILIIRVLLEQEGFRVLTAGNAEEAIELHARHMKEIELTVSDIVLPGMNGVQMSKELLKLNPLMKFLFMSGYSAETLGQYGNFSEDANFISKPFSIIRFLNMVQTVLKKETPLAR